MSGVDGGGDFLGLDVLAGVAGIFEFVAAAAQRSQGGEGACELGADGVGDREVSAGLGGPQALLGQQGFTDEASRVLFPGPIMVITPG